MNGKRRKIKKVLGLREQALDKRARELVLAKSQLVEAVDEHTRESERLLLAQHEREKLASGSIDVGSWVEAEQWLAQKRNDVGRACCRVNAAEETVQHAWHGVVEARIDKKRIELLDTRLAATALKTENRQEQRLADELAQRGRKQEESGDA